MSSPPLHPRWRAARPRLVVLAPFLLLFLAAPLRAAQDDPGSEDEPVDVTQLTPINAMCPVMPDEPVEPEYTVVHQGQAIGLCCSTCRRKFRRDPEKYLALVTEFVPAEAAPPTEEPKPDEPKPDGEPAPAPDPAPAPASPSGAAVPGWVKAAGRFHPVVVHFPIALLLAGAFAQLVDTLRRRSSLRSAMRYCLGLGALGGVVAALLGWAAGAGVSFPSEDATWFERHRVAGIATAVLGVLAFALSLRLPSDGSRSRRHTLLCWVLFATAAAVGLTGYLGGALVYGPDHLGF